jgi:SagB-type dehydrogenase family enzyme
MQTLYQKSALSRKIVAMQSGFMDWDTQPFSFKHYPDFLFYYSYGEKEQLRLLEIARCVTSAQQVAKKPYYRLNTPSAGNLHPIELYVQIRSLKGIMNGIYHIDPTRQRIVLIKEIEKEGLEEVLGIQNRFGGMLFFVSCVPFRSEWKYGVRALRYCYLDAGHQIGALKAALSLQKQEATILSDFDVLALNYTMGFKDEEFVCAVFALGKESDKKAEPMKRPLIHVAPTDYSEKMESAALIAQGRVFTQNTPPFETELQAVLERRSARKFSKESIKETDMSHFMQLLSTPYSPLQCYSVILQETASYEKGIYRNGELIQKGEFVQPIVSLLLDQQFLKSAQIIIIITAKEFTPDTLMLSGLFAHSLALHLEASHIGFSGIGAFYDAMLQKFLDTQEYILYVNAMGE